ncbi:MAG: SpoIIE family protein phosphatase [Streptosporangiaceae bacterium]
MTTPEPDGTTRQVAELEARYAALQQAARSRGADPGGMLDAAFTELEAAIDLLREAGTGSGAGQPGDHDGAGGSDNTERGLLRAAFQDAPVPLFLITRDGTVQRVNRAAGDLIGARPGYATGRPFTVFVHGPSRAAVNSQLTAVARTGKQRTVRCSLVAEHGLVPCELVIGRVVVRGEADPLMVTVRDPAVRDPGVRDPAVREAAARDSAGPKAGARRAAGNAPDEQEPVTPERLGAVQAVTRRLDLVTTVARLLLENEGFSESRMLQRCARLIAAELTAWVIVDIERRHRVRRQFVTGPDDPGLAELTRLLAAVDPPPGSVPCTVHESGRPTLMAHAEDPEVIGVSMDGEPLLSKLDASSVLSVPLADGDNRYGVLTLVRRSADGHFKVADLALMEELGEQMALAIRVDRTFRRRAETADALHASVLPRKMPEIPGLEIAATYLASAEDLEVGGDFYDVYQTPSGWGLAVGDVCGKGDEAAAVTAAARHAIRVLARRHDDPAEVLALANEIVLAEVGGIDGGFVTANIAHLSWDGNQLRVIVGSAGHPAAMLLRSDGRVSMLNGGGLPLGLFPEGEAATQDLLMDRGDVLFLYTDGVAQARGADNTYFQDRLSDELAGLAGEKPADLLAAMRSAMLKFSTGNLIDDVTMLVLRAGTRPRTTTQAPAPRTRTTARPAS